MNKHSSLLSIIKDISYGIIATLLMGVGISLFVSCQLGSDPVTVFLDGFNKTTGISIGITDQFLNLCTLVLGIILNRKLIGISSIVNVLVLGMCIDIPTAIFIPLHISEQSLLIRILVLIIAQICLGTSFAWMQTFKSGMNPIDAIFFRIINRFNCRYFTIRVIYDGLYLLIGYILGGVIGIGTILSIVTNGYITEHAKKAIIYAQIKFGGNKNG